MTRLWHVIFWIFSLIDWLITCLTVYWRNRSFFSTSLLIKWYFNCYSLELYPIEILLMVFSPQNTRAEFLVVMAAKINKKNQGKSSVNQLREAGGRFHLQHNYSSYCAPTSANTVVYLSDIIVSSSSQFSKAFILREQSKSFIFPSFFLTYVWLNQILLEKARWLYYVKNDN